MKNVKNSYVAVVGRRRKTTKFFQNWRQSAEATGAYGIWSHSARGECTRTLYVIIMKWGVFFYFVWGLWATFQEISAHREKKHDLNYASVSPLWLWPERRHRPPAERRIKYDITCDEQDGGLSSVVSQVSSVLRFLLLDCGNMCKQSKCISIFSSWYFSLGSMTSTSSSTPVIANWRRHRESRQRSHAVDWFMFVLAKGGSN